MDGHEVPEECTSVLVIMIPTQKSGDRRLVEGSFTC